MKHLMLFEAYSKIHDDILDKISKSGFDSLTPREKKIISNIDMDYDEPEEIQKPTIKPKYNNQFLNKKYTDTTGKITFVLKEIDDEEKEVNYSGILYHNGLIYNGYMSKDKETDAPYFDFKTANGDEFYPANYNLHYEFDDLMQEVFYDDDLKIK